MHRLWVFVALGFVLWTLDRGEAKKIPRWWLKIAEKQGPNACVVEEVPGTSKEFWTECRYWLKRRICGKKTRIRFECCEGFDQVDGENGCTLVKPLKNVLETAESMGATKWASYIRESGLENEFESAGAYTLFAPTNEAFDEMKNSVRRQVEAYRGNPSNPVIYYHVVQSKLRSEDFDGDQSVETRHQGHNIRINKYSNGMTTINCALLLRKDQEATNGIVHIIDGVLDPSATISNNVADMILDDGRFTVMAEMLEKSGYVNVLRTFQDSITILAPSDEAFQKLADSRREKIINDREARLALLQNHVIPHVICESAITGQHKVRTMSNNRLMFNCDIDGTYVEDTKMRGDFNLGKNGIIHTIDDVLLPDRAKNLVELAESRQLDTFVDFVKKSGLEETLSHTGDYTFFVPDENAWLEMAPETMELARRDPEYAGLMLRFHGAYGRHFTNAITDNQGIMSLNEENPVRLQIWRRAVGVEDAKITESDLEAQNGVIHIINKVIFPSNKSLEDILTSIKGHTFQSFLEILTTVTTESPSLLHLGPGANVYYTFFVPTDRAFDQMYQEDLRRIKSSVEQRQRFVSNHIAVNMFPETSFEPGLIYSVDGLGSEFNIRKDPYGKLMVNGSDVLSSHMSANGVIHVTDKVFLPPDHQTITRVEEKTIEISHPNSRGGSSWRFHNSTRTIRKHYDEILPAYPQGSVIIGSLGRKPQHVLPPRQGKKSRRRGSHRKRYHAARGSLTVTSPPKTTVSTTSKIPTTSTTSTTTTPKTTSTTSTTTSTEATTTSSTTNTPCTTKSSILSSDVEYERNTVTHAESALHETNERSPQLIRVDQNNAGPVIYNRGTFLTEKSGRQSETNPYNRYGYRRENFDHKTNIEKGNHLFNKHVIETQYDMSYYSNHSTNYNVSASSVPKLLTYNSDWDVPVPQPLNTTRTYTYAKNSTNISTFPEISSIMLNNLDESRKDSHLRNSKIYSYSYSTNSVNPALHGKNIGAYNYSGNVISGDRRAYSLAPIPPDGRSFNYVGHHYGDDVPGHESKSPLPFSSAQSSFVRKDTSRDRNVIRPSPMPISRGGANIHGGSTTRIRQSTYPQPIRSSTYLKKSSRTFSMPLNKTPVPSIGLSGKMHSDLLSAYAFTNEGHDFADGTEFSEARVPSEKVIAIEQAKILRREWRRKRRHLKKRNKLRKGHKKGRRNFRRRRLMKNKE